MPAQVAANGHTRTIRRHKRNYGEPTQALPWCDGHLWRDHEPVFPPQPSTGG